MKIKYQDIKYLIFSVAIFALALQAHRMLLKPASTNIDTEKIEEVLKKMETKAENLLQETLNSIKKGEFIYIEDSVMLHKEATDFPPNSYTLLIYKNDSLKYWSNNLAQVPVVYNEDLFPEKKISLIANAWYECLNTNYDDYKLVALIKIKNNYTYKNKYLKNSYNPAFDIPPATDISDKPARGAVNINGKNGNIVFALNYSKQITPVAETNGVISIIYFISFIFFLLFLNHVYTIIAEKKYSVLYLLLLTGLVLILRYLMIRYKTPYFIYALSFFEPEIYAGSKLFPLLGDFFFNALLLFFLTENLFKIFKLQEYIQILIKKNSKYIYFITAFLLSISGLFLYWVGVLFQDLLFNSDISFELFRFREITIFSVISYLIFGILGAAFIRLTDKIFKLLCLFKSFKELMLYVAIGMLPSLILFLVASEAALMLSTLYISAIAAIFLVRSFRQDYSIHTLMLFVGGIALFIVWFISEKEREKNKDIQKILVTQLYDERDDVAELLIREIDSRLKSDTTLQKMMMATSPKHKLMVHDYLNRKYFYGYWDKYKLSITLCGNVDIYSDANQADYCKTYFKDVLKAYDKKLDNSSFSYLNNTDGTITYFTSVSVNPTIDPRKITLYIQLKEKANLNEVGYPELLVDEDVKLSSVFDKYSYAKYNSGTLAARSGEYSYNLSQDNYIEKMKKENSFFKENGYLHYVYAFGDSNIIILSRKLPNILDHIVAFSYLFVFFSISLIIAILVVNHRFLIIKLKPDFKNKIQFALISILAATFVIFVAGTVYYAIEQDKQSVRRNMTKTVQSVIIEMEHKLENEDVLTPDWSSEKYEHFDELLIKFSQVFFIDINLYDTKGSLLGTSRSEIYERELLGKQMNSKAFAALAAEKKILFIQNENIGNFEYASIYLPFKNKDNKTIAYVHLPFFIQDEALQNNISALLISTVNIYILFFLISVFISVLIANSISHPLRMLQSKFKNIQLGQKHQEISYPKNDEIGDLVKEYNRMNEELQESVRKLAESERESAWREMAKQIAHEIKNPLTPMKLSVQLLLRTWSNQDDNFGERLKKVSETLIEQIDTLSAIASEFSAFAKMPKAHNEKVDLVSKLQTVVQLFDNEEKTKISLETHNQKEVMILADKEQLSRVFINVIKNGIQSVPEGISAEIYVELTTYGNNAKVTIEDNGSGIPESKKDKLFKPSFTTKTKGMGMGLAIVKNIVNNANGEIWFESEENKGTKFFIEFPLYGESPLR